MPSQQQLDEVKSAARFVAYLALGVGVLLGMLLMFIVHLVF